MTKTDLDPVRIAHWSRRRKIVWVWLSPNLFGEREAKTIAEARQWIKDSGISQTLTVAE